MPKYGLIAILTILSVTVGMAQEPSNKGPNGGMVVTSQGHPIELVLKGQELVFYLNDDDGSPLATKGMRGRATVLDAGKTLTVTLQPSPPNKLIGELQAPLGSKARVVLSTSFRVGAHTHTLTARYVTE